MQKYWLPFRKSESYASNLSKDPHLTTTLTEATERVEFRKNDKNSIPESRNNLSKIVIDQTELLKKSITGTPQSRTFSKPETVTVTENRNNQHGFTAARDYNNSFKDRKRTSTEAVEEPARKKIQFKNDGVIPTKNEHTNGANVQSEVVQSVKKVNPSQAIKQERCLTGDVAQILKFNKNYPSLSAFYEVYANVYKVDSSKAGQKILLLRNHSGPVVQGIFYEIDVRMIEVKAGDAVRCVGKFINNSRLNLFKVSLLRENNRQLVSRLYSLAHFELGHQ